MDRALYLTVDQDGTTGWPQVAIHELDENGVGGGYRLAGPKYNGSSKRLVTHKITALDAAELRRVLNKYFPEADDV